MSASNSLPLSSFPSEGDSEVIPTEEIPSSNPAFLSNPAGDSDNHSSTVSSISNGDGDASQYDDDELGNPSAGHLDPAGYDPNMSGPKATQEIDDYRAGYLSGMNGGMLPMDSAEEYHTWAEFSGVAEAFGSDSVSPQGSFEGLPDTISGIQVFPVVRRA